ncbi:MAG: GNAT family N-acetyltransferase [Gammaproteobacteria bacterium]|nr:GNAT family N-acetyltransferase [Gammaproteobacteria bacterium]
MDRDAIHAFLATSYWSEGIPKDTLVKAMQQSLCFGLFEGQQQIGFARAVTDRATFAYLADVYIEPTHRDKGLGIWLTEQLMAHTDLQGLRRMMLATRDAHSLYRRFGFTKLTKPNTIMERWRPAIYREGKE